MVTVAEIEAELAARINRAHRIANADGASGRTTVKFRHSASELSDLLGWIRKGTT